jgi:hypothetical protein
MRGSFPASDLGVYHSFCFCQAEVRLQPHNIVGRSLWLFPVVTQSDS